MTADERSAVLARHRVDCFGEMVILAPEKLRYQGRPDGTGEVRINGYEDLRLRAAGMRSLATPCYGPAG